MISRIQISHKLKTLGYELATQNKSYDRFTALFIQGSLYVKDGYISASRDLKLVENTVPRTSSDSKGNPEWRDSAVYNALNQLEEMASKIHERNKYAVDNISEIIQVPSLRDIMPAEATNVHIDWSATGIYIAFPTSPLLKPIYRGYATKVNNQHTKVGIARDSFSSRKNSYMNTFDGEVVFLPVVVIDAKLVESRENIILNKLSKLYPRVGRAREWFYTTDTKAVLQIINETTG